MSIQWVKCSERFLVFIYFFLYFVGLVVDGHGNCPDQCKCSSTVINCSSKGLEEIPKILQNNSNEEYQSLLLNNNRITLITMDSINPNIAFMLIELKLNINRIKNITAEAFTKMESLKSLDLSNNLISDIENSFKNNGELKVLNLSHNDIQSLTSSMFIGLRSLKILLLQNNKINILTKEVFNNMNKLNFLDLSNNLISKIQPKSFRKNGKLMVLNLSHNTIYSLRPNEFLGLKNLKNLFLQNNMIDNLPENIFKHMSDLLKLYLSFNRLEALNKDIFSKLNNLQTVHLDNNPWMCTCENLYGYQQWLLSTNNTMLYDLNCMDYNNENLSSVQMLCTSSTVWFKGCNRVAILNETIQISCEAFGYPIPTLSWSLPFNETDKETMMKEMPPIKGIISTVQVINQVMFKHGGLYTCWAKNVVGTESANCSLDVVVGSSTTDVTTGEANRFRIMMGAISGAILLFCTVGLLLFWRFNKSRRLEEDTVYNSTTRGAEDWTELDPVVHTLDFRDSSGYISELYKKQGSLFEFLEQNFQMEERC